MILSSLLSFAPQRLLFSTISCHDKISPAPEGVVTCTLPLIYTLLSFCLSLVHPHSHRITPPHNYLYSTHLPVHICSTMLLNALDYPFPPGHLPPFPFLSVVIPFSSQ